MQYTGGSQFVEDYIEQMTTIMKRTHPDWAEPKLKKEIRKIVERRTNDLPVSVENNYTGQKKDTTLLTLFDWEKKRKPIVGGNATFYKRQGESFNPNAVMLLTMLQERKSIKKEMFQLDDYDSYVYKDKDRKQANVKKLINSWYGGSGAPHAAFYSEFSIPATTGAAQSVISSTLWLFEPLLGDNYKFSDINECFHWMEYVLKDNEDGVMDTWIKIVNRDKLYYRLKNKMYRWDPSYGPVLNAYIDGLTDYEVTYIYYQNNLIEFINAHPSVQKIITTILGETKPAHMIDEKNDRNFEDEIDSKYRGMFKTAKDYNRHIAKEGFFDPNSVPDNLAPHLEMLYSIVRKYCTVPYLAFDRIWKLKNLKRMVVTVIDTDSNILSLDTIVNFIKDRLLTQSFGKSTEQNEIIIVNTITYIISNAVGELLHLYGTHSNVDEEYKKYLGMKNEFFMDRLFVGNSKKRYFSSIRLREGNMLIKPKQDIKGFEIMKSVVSSETSSLFKGMIKRYFLDPPEPRVKECLEELIAFKNSVMKSIQDGELRYLPIGSCKDADSYADASSQPSYRGAVAWNYLYPDAAIEFPSKASLLKLNLQREESIEPLKETHPDIYEILKTKIFHDTTKLYVRTKKDKNEKVTTSSTGMSVLAIPTNERIPEWCIPYIDYTSLVNTIISPFNPILEIFGIPKISEGKTSTGETQTERFTNILKF